MAGPILEINFYSFANKIGPGSAYTRSERVARNFEKNTKRIQVGL